MISRDLSALVLAVSCAGIAVAQDGFPDDVVEAAETDAPDTVDTLEVPRVSRDFIRLTAGGSGMFDADIDDGGDVSVNRFFSRVDGRLHLDEGNFLELGFGYQFDSYDFSGSEGFGGLDPWGDVHRFGVRVIANSRIDKEWRVFFGPLVGMAGETGGGLGSNAIVAGGQFGAAYVVAEDLVLGFGVTAMSQIEDDARVVPLLFFDWKFKEDWTLRVGNFHLGAEGGPGLELAHQYTEAVELSLGFDYTRRRFRLDDDGIAPEGVGQTEAFSVYGKVAWDLTPQTELALSVGVAVGGELRLEDEDGHKVSDEDFDPALAIAARLRFRF